jgi:hypothetical protein
MIKILDLSDKAQKILKEAYPIRKEWDNEKFINAYTDFTKETNLEYKELGFNGFQVAIKRYQTQQIQKDCLDTKTYHPKYCSLEQYIEHKRREAVDEYYRG